jgi:hypothetical protein
LSLVACRLSLVACRLSLVACRLSLVACRLSLVTCRLVLVGCVNCSLLLSPAPQPHSFSCRRPVPVLCRYSVTNSYNLTETVARAIPGYETVCRKSLRQWWLKRVSCSLPPPVLPNPPSSQPLRLFALLALVPVDCAWALVLLSGGEQHQGQGPTGEPQF